MDTKEGIKEGIKALWAIAYMAAYLQSQFPIWVRSETTRRNMPVDTDRWRIAVPYEMDLNFRNPLPYFEPPPDLTVELIEHRVGIEGVSEIFDGKYSVGLGFGYHPPTDFGVVLWWTEKWVKVDAKELFDWLNTTNN